MVAASIVCTVSAKTADFVVVVNDSMVRVNDDSAIFRGLYSGQRRSSVDGLTKIFG